MCILQLELCSGAESLGSILWPGSEEGDIVWCLAFLGTLCGQPIFKVKKSAGGMAAREDTEEANW